jgi:prepilin-type N-terminal cleavage/methylation domain-containing protein
MSPIRDQRGFSLIELLVAILLAMIIFGAATTAFVSFLGVSTKTEDQQRAQDAARSTIERLSAHLRNAMTNGSSNAVVSPSSSGFDLIFVTAMPGTATSSTNPRGLTHVRYCLESRGSKKDDRLFFQTAPYSTASTAPPSTLSCPDTAWSTKHVFSDHYVNRSQPGAPPLFTYKTDSATPPNITGVAMHPILDWAPSRDPIPTELNTSVTLRNLNRVPTAALSCSGLANGHAVCDGSASTDPDGEQLTYLWKMNGSTLSTETSSRLDKYPLTSKATYTFALTVTDAGGLSSTATRSVTIP